MGMHNYFRRVRNYLKRQRSASETRERTRSRLRAYRPVLETLEERVCPDAVSWIAATSGSWGSAANWLDSSNSQHRVPTAADDVTINQAGVTVTVDAAESANSVTATTPITLASGGTLTVGSSAGPGIFSDTSTVSISGGTLADAAVQSGTILQGSGYGNTLNNVTIDGVLDLATNFTSLTVSGGLVLNGTVNIERGSQLLFSGSGDQTLSGGGTVTFGELDATTAMGAAAAGTTLVIGQNITVDGTTGMIGDNFAASGSGGLINDGTIDANGTSGGVRVLTIAATTWSNAGTIEATSGNTIDLGGTSTALAPAWTNEPGATITTTGGTIDLGGSGTLPTSGYAPGSNWLNKGGISESGGTIGLAFFNNVSDTITPAALGTLTRLGGAADGTLNLQGTLINTGATLVLDGNAGTSASSGSTYTMPGSLVLVAGTIQGGTVQTQNGATLISGHAFSGFNNALAGGVTLDGTLDMATFAYSLTVTGGLTLNGTINLNDSNLLFSGGGSQTLSTNTGGTVSFGSFSVTGLGPAASDTTFVIGAGITVDGNSGEIGYIPGSASAGNVINDGTINADSSANDGITINPASFTNNGIVESSNGDTVIVTPTTLTNFSSGTLTGGTWEAQGGGTLRLIAVSIATNAATILLDGTSSSDGTPSSIDNTNGTVEPVNALASFSTNAATGSFTIQNGVNLSTAQAFSNAGSVTIGSGSAFTLGGNEYFQSGGTTVLSGGTLGALVDDVVIGGGTLSGPGTIGTNLTNDAEVDLGGSPGTLTIAGSYNQSSVATLTVQVGGTGAGQFDQVNVAGSAALGGTLTAKLVNGFTPSAGETFPVVTFGTLSGTGYSTFNSPTYFDGSPVFSTQYALQGVNLMVNNAPAAPAAPSNFVVTAVTASSIAFSWTDNDPSATSYQVEELGIGAPFEVPGSPFGPNTTSASVTDLLSGTIYDFEIVAVNPAGASAPLASGDIQTLISTLTSVSGDPNPLVLNTPESNASDTGNDVTFTATVTNNSAMSDTIGTPDTPAGQVDFQDMTTGTDLGTVPLQDDGAGLGTATATLYASPFDLGKHTIVATYTPDPASSFVGSQDSATEAVEAFTSTFVTATPEPGIAGQPVAFTAFVSNGWGDGGTPTGTVQFQINGTNYGQPVAVDEYGQASINDPSLAQGRYDISASYLPTGNFASSQSETSAAVDIGDSWTGNAGDSNWDNRFNWNNGVPQAGYDVYISNLPPNTIINLGPADVANNVTVSSALTLSGGTLTVGGMMTDSAPFTLENAATVTLPNGFMMDDVTIQQGRVQPDSDFSGHGTIRGNLVNDGALDMGDTPGKIIVEGNYTQGPTGTLTAKIAGAFASQMDQLDVAGATVLDGTLKVTLMDNFVPVENQTLSIVNATLPINGAFSVFDVPMHNGAAAVHTVNVPGGVGIVGNAPPPSVAVTYSGVPTWTAEGPAPNVNAQVDSSPDNGDDGAIASVVVAPNKVYVGTVNGGVWTSTELTSSIITGIGNGSIVPSQLGQFWTPLTDSQPSLAVSTMALDPNDQSGNTLWVGTGSLSSYSSSGGPAIGILKTSNGGTSWSVLGGASLSGDTILSLVPTVNNDPTKQVILVGTNGQGLWRSPDGGATFAQIAFPFTTSAYSSVVVSSIVADPHPTNAGDYYAALTLSNPTFTGDTVANSATVTNVSDLGGLFRGEPVGGTGIPAGTTIAGFSGTTIRLSTAATASNTGITFTATYSTSVVLESYNYGENWIEIDNSIPQITNSPLLELAASANPDGATNLYVATTQNSNIPNSSWAQQLTGFLRAEVTSTPLAPVSWLPIIDNGGNEIGQPVATGNFYLATRPGFPDAIYVGGAVQLLSVGVVTGLTNNGTALASSWEQLSNGNSLNSNPEGDPHDDQRSIAFLPDGTMLATNDGGIYGLSVTGNNHWVDCNEDIQATEFLQVAYDSNAGVIIGGSQDNGTPVQGSPGSPYWDPAGSPGGLLQGGFGGAGDGGAVAVDNSNSQSLYYFFSDGRLRTSYANSGGWNPVKLQGSSNGSPNGSDYSGLNPADQGTYKGIEFNPQDNSFEVVVNPFGAPPGSVAGAAAPILLGGATTMALLAGHGSELNGLYESARAGLVITQPAVAGNPGTPTAMAYASLGGAAYFADNTGHLFYRDAYGDTFFGTDWNPVNGTIVQIVPDPNPSPAQIVYVLTQAGAIWESEQGNAGGWVNLTASTNVPSVTSIAVFDPTPYSIGNSVLLAGTQTGVYRMNANDNTAFTPSPTSWNLFGQGLPNAKVDTLEYVPLNPNTGFGDLLLVGTMGRGAWEVANAIATLTQAAQAAITASNATIVLRTDPAVPANAQLLLGGPGATISQVINAGQVKMEEPWANLSGIGIDLDSSTVDILNVPAGVTVAVTAAVGTDVVNVGSAANQLTSVAGAVSLRGNGNPCTLNVDDQGDSSNALWTIGNSSVSLGGSATIGYQFADVVVNAGTGINTFTANNTLHNQSMTLNTGSGNAGNAVVLPLGSGPYQTSVNVVETGRGSTLNIDNGSPTIVTVESTGSGSTTSITSSSTDTIFLGNNGMCRAFWVRYLSTLRSPIPIR